jgi:C-terminal processing protease CtpA/Prc
MSIHYPPTESVKEAIKTLRDNNVKSFVLDLRNNRFEPAEIGMYVDV